jgi:glutathione S-transferase
LQPSLELYFRPFACSLACRIALLEARLEARYHEVDIDRKTVLADGGDYRLVAPQGKVPALRLADGTLLTENAAVLQFLADLRPESGLAPPPGAPERYRLQEWLSFVGMELHKGFAYPTFLTGTPEPVRAHARERCAQPLAHAAAHLEKRPFLVGDRFTVADAYLTWALVLVRFAGVDLSPWPALAGYLERMQARPSVAAALAAERPLLQTASR